MYNKNSIEDVFPAWEKISEGPWTKRRKHQVVVWQNRILLMGGFDGESAYDLNDVWSWEENVLTENQPAKTVRVDEGNWRLVCNSAGWSGRDGHCAVVLRNQIFVLGGTDDPFLCKSDVWSSLDGGFTWNCLLEVSPWPERWQHAACVHTHKNVTRIYVTGGWGECYLNDVWSSVDGATWIKVCAAAPWRPRMFHSVVSFKDSLYIIGGHDGHTQLNDVWASADGGHSWIQVCQNAQWPCRQGHTTVVLENNLYLVGGFGGSSRFNDTWKSSDAAHWVAVPCAATWSARQGHAAAAFDGCVFVFGGFDESGYCNTAYRLRISNSDPQSSRRKSADGKLHDAVDHFENDRPQKILTVSITSVMNTLRTLHMKRSRHEYLVQALINILALVMSAIRPSNPEAVTISEKVGRSASPQDEWYTEFAESISTQGDPGFRNRIKLKLDISNLETTSMAAGNLGKVGSPFRENFLESRRATSLDSYSTMLKRDFQLQLFDVSAALSPNNRRILTKPSSSEWNRSINQASLMAGPLCRPEIADTVDGTGILIHSLLPNKSQDEFNDLDTSNDEILSSALLHDNMEKYRRGLSTLQHQIRFNAEQDNISEMNASVAERHVLAGKAFKEAVLLHEHLGAVLKMHDQKNSHVMKILASTEEIRVHHIQSYREAFHDHAPGNSLSDNSSQMKEYSDIQGEPQIFSSDENNFCSWQTWRETMSKCVEMIHSLDSSVCNASVDALLQVMDSISRLSSASAHWLAERSSANPPSSARPLDISKQSERQNDGEFTEDSQVPLLGEEYEAALESQDRCKLTAKVHADQENARIDHLEADMIATLELACKNGFGLLNSVLHQNNQHIIEVKNMQSEVKTWLEKVGYLTDAVKLEAECVKLISENQSLEEELLQLENTRIDVKSAYEKAALNAHSSRHSLLAKHSYYRQSVGQDEEISTTKTKDQSLIAVELNNLREIWNKVENDVRRKRRDFRNWYRDNKNFAVEFCPELFHYLPDFRTPGSILGDGGFADMAKVPRRKLEDYDDISPLIPSLASSSVELKQRQGLTSGRHILLKASLDGESVVLKGFVMNNFAQRKGFERELQVLSKLKNDSIICPGAIVEGSGAASDSSGGNGWGDPSLQATIFIQYPFCAGGNLSQWLKAEVRKPWELQAIARQILYALLYLHDNGVVHKDIKPSNILLHEDGRIVLADFELAKEMRRRSVNIGDRSGAEEVVLAKGVDEEDDITASVSVSGTRGFMAPEIESGGQAVYASDMYSFGVVLATMHFPAALDRWVPGQPLSMAMTMPLSPMPRRGESNSGAGTGAGIGGDADLIQLVHKLLAIDAKERPTAASCVNHPYFRASYMDRLESEGELVAQDRKLEAVRHLLKKTHFTYRNSYDKVTVRRSQVCEDTLEYFLQLEKLKQMDKIKSNLKVTFANEPGIDQGGLLTEMFSMYFEDIFSESNPCGLFETQAAGSFEGEQRRGSPGSAYTTVLPSAQDALPERMQRLRAVGASIVKALYEGKRIGSRLCPFVFKFIASTNPNPTLRDLQYFDPQTAKSLQWMLVTSGVEQFGLHFESIGQPDLGPVSDTNKVQFVGMKIEKILMHNRFQQLSALKKGFVDALTALSEEAAPFLSLLSHTDWRVMLCGDSSVNAHQIVSSLSFSDFPKKSGVPQWLAELLLTLSEDALRKFLVFVTGSPSLPASFAPSEFKVNVRCLPRSMSLPVAHTCFFHLDIPDYKDKETLQNKLLYAIQNANTYEIV